MDIFHSLKFLLVRTGVGPFLVHFFPVPSASGAFVHERILTASPIRSCYTERRGHAERARRIFTNFAPK